MSSLPLPQIDQARCTGCGRCISACPTVALAQPLDQPHGKAYLQNAAACTYCTACEELCPEDAIALPFVVVLAANQHQGRKPTGRPRTKPTHTGSNHVV